jgi:hypothetical protein
VSIRIHLDDGGSDIVGSMTGGPADWTYATTFYPRHGQATVTYTITGPTPISIPFNIYVDPAGYVYYVATGARVSGATVWLQEPDGQGGWENVTTGQNPPVMLPDVNPQTTASDGQFQWDVLPGIYRVHVEAAGYDAADSIVVSVPPPVTDLQIGLTRVVASPSIVTMLSSSTITAGGSVTDSATLTGAWNDAGGTVTYEYFSGDTCTGTPTAVGSPVTVTNGVVPDSASQSFNTAGSYSWNAVYSGDAYNMGAVSPCEALTVIPAGWMTGNGRFDVPFLLTHGFTVSCNANQGPNRLEVKWVTGGRAYAFRMTDLLTAVCVMNPALGSPNPLAANFNTWNGTVTGRLNGVAGYTLFASFTAQKEPIVGKDISVLVITAPDGTVVLNVTAVLKVGSHYAHHPRTVALAVSAGLL